MSLISVVIPLYNKEVHIGRTLKSVLNQTVQQFEVIVVNDGSKDSGPEIVRGFEDERIKLINQENKGVSAARNKGISEAKSELIAFLDADDEWKPTFLETILRLRSKFQIAGAFATNYEKVSNSQRNKKIINNISSDSLLHNYFVLSCKETLFCSSSIAIPKGIFEDVGYFNEKVKRGEDVDMWGRIAMKYPIAYSPNPESIYHTDATNRSSNKKSLINEELYPFISTANNAIDSNLVSMNVLEDLTEYISYLEIGTASHFVCEGYRIQALNILKNCKTRTHFYYKVKWLLLASIPTPLFRAIQKSKHFLLK